MLWLACYVFCSRSIQVAKKFIILVNQLNVGHDLCLSEIILAHLYESLGEGVTDLKNPNDKGNLLISGPFWLLQLWLNASFEASLLYLNLIDAKVGEIKNKKVEGIHMAQLTPSEEGHNLQQTFSSYVMVFVKLYNFTSSMASFSTRPYGPEWFTRKFLALLKDQATESISIWETFLTPRVISPKLRPSKNQITLLSYQPNLVALQFGLIQILPKPLFTKKNALLHTT